MFVYGDEADLKADVCNDDDNADGIDDDGDDGDGIYTMVMTMMMMMGYLLAQYHQGPWLQQIQKPSIPNYKPATSNKQCPHYDDDYDNDEDDGGYDDDYDDDYEDYHDDDDDDYDDDDGDAGYETD